MPTDELLNNIAARLYKESICVTPLDEKSLEIISKYMNYYSSHSDLSRRLSDVEMNYVQISCDAENACNIAIESTNEIIVISKRLIDQWHKNGYLADYYFSSSATQTFNMCKTYINALECIRNQLKQLSNSLLTFSETAAQIRACSASFGEIYKESKLAIYAAKLNRDVETILDSRATSLLAHASTKECEKLSAKLMGNALKCTRIINCVNNMTIEVNQHLKIDENEYEMRAKAAPLMAKNCICSAIGALENINIEKNN